MRPFQRALCSLILMVTLGTPGVSLGDPQTKEPSKRHPSKERLWKDHSDGAHDLYSQAQRESFLATDDLSLAVISSGTFGLAWALEDLGKYFIEERGVQGGLKKILPKKLPALPFTVVKVGAIAATTLYGYRAFTHKWNEQILTERYREEKNRAYSLSPEVIQIRKELKLDTEPGKK